MPRRIMEKGLTWMYSSVRDLPNGQPLLNFDVLHLVCGYLTDISDVLSFALTCSALTEDALRRRLSMSPVNLLNHNSINRFHSFIFTNKDARAPYIYGLTLPGPHTDNIRVMDQSQSQVSVDRLVSLLEAAVHIQYLYFPTSISSPVLNAAMQLTTLRELHMFCDTYHAPLHILFNTLRSPLRSLSIHEPNDCIGDGIFATVLHNHLSPFRPTLEALDVDYVKLDILPSITTQFIAVRSLKIKVDFIFQLDALATLLQLFPNLNNTLVLDRFIGDVEDEDVYPPLRLRNKEAQRAHSWSGLDRLDCDAQTAFIVSLQCPIRRMDIEAIQPESKQFLATTLRQNSPRHLHLSLSFYFGLGVLDGLHPVELADTLTHLSIFAEFRVRHKWKAHPRRKRMPWNRFFNRVIASVKHLRVTYLRVVFHCTARQEVPNSFKYGGSFVNVAREVDLYSVARRFMDEIPSLTHLFLTTCGRAYIIHRGGVYDSQKPLTWVESKAWRAVRSQEPPPSESNVPSGSCTVELSDDAAREIMDREELHLSRHEEDEIQECDEWTDLVDLWSFIPRKAARGVRDPVYRCRHHTWVPLPH